MEQQSTEVVRMTPPASYARYQRLDSFTTYLPLKEARELWFFPPGAAKIHMALIGASGSGKSRLLGRLLGYYEVKKRKPLVIIDPTGSTIDNLLDRIVRRPGAWREQFWPRITYVDVGAEDYILPPPLFYRLGERDTLFTIANRFPSIIKRQDPDLQSAPILGWNSLYACAINAGMIATALGKQLDFVTALVQQPGRFKEELKQALASDPMLAPAVEYFRQMMDPSSHSLREKRTGSFITKLIPFFSDPLLLASFSGQGQGIDWEKVSREGHTVLIDLRHVHDPDSRQFSMLWYFKSFTDYIKYRGMAGRAQPITLIIDELADMLSQQDGNGRSLLAQDLEELAARHARNYGVNLVLALQSLSSVEPGVQNVLLQLGTMVAGRIANHEDALIIAKNLLIYDPYLIKKIENVWMGMAESLRNGTTPPPFGPDRSIPTVIDTRTVEFTLEEQLTMFADQLKQLQRFEFLVRAATGEGKINHQVRELSLAHEDEGQYPDESYIAYFRQCLRQACGIPVKELLDEINQRRPAVQLDQKPPKKKADKPKEKARSAHDTMNGDAAHDTQSHSLPRATTAPSAHTNGDTNGATTAQASPTDDEAITWR